MHSLRVFFVSFLDMIGSKITNEVSFSLRRHSYLLLIYKLEPSRSNLEITEISDKIFTKSCVNLAIMNFMSF